MFTDPEVDLLLGPSPGLGRAIAVYVFEPDELVFANPVTITVVKDVSDLNENQRSRFNLYLYIEPNFHDLEADCTVAEDPPGTFIATCTAELDHFSMYGAIAPLDTDDDGVFDEFDGVVDNCPDDPNPGQADTDEDGVGDVCDPCPLDNPDDTDGDGVCDSADICPGGDDNIDCQPNEVPDYCDISGGTSNDCNSNEIPDECDTIGSGDFDCDGDVDLTDFVGLADCMAGPGVPPTPAAPECVGACLDGFDFDADGDVDMDDFILFQDGFASP